MERGELVPDDITVRMLLERLAAPDATAGVILDGFPRTKAQAEALDDALAEHGGRVDHALEIEVPAEELVRRMSGRWICAENGHVYHETSHPPRVPGRCDLDRSPLIQRDDDRPETIRARLAVQLGALGEVVAHYRERRRPPDGRRRADGRCGGRRDPGRRPAGDRGRAGRSGRRLMTVTLKSPAEIARMRRAGAVVAEVLALVESELRPGVSTAHLDALAEAHIRRSGARPVVQGLPGDQPAPAVPGLHLHLDRRRDRPRHPRRPDPPRGPGRLDRRRRHRRRLARRRRPDVLRRAPRRAAVRGLIDATRLAMMAGIAAAVPGARIEDISAAVEDVATPAGYGVIRQFVGHGIGRAMHEEPQVPNYRVGRGRPSARARACAWPSSRCSPSARTTPGSSTTTGPSSPATARSPPISSTPSPSPSEDRRSSPPSDDRRPACRIDHRLLS